MEVRFVEGAVVADRFRLVRRLGTGGMGEVWLARHTALDVLCAVKFIYPEAASSPELRARFELEAKVAAQLRSAHVVQILDTGLFDDAPYIAMEYLEGEDLGQRLKRVKVLDARQTAEIIEQVSRALGRAHAAGLIHRDLKPANIFLSMEDDREVAKVLDFGVVKRTGGAGEGASGSATETGMLLGTPHYMSPEQAEGKKSIDHRSDLWALGVVAFRCLTGKLPFQSAALPDLLGMIVRDPLPVPSRVGPVPPGFDAWWARAASRNPNQRFQSAKELAATLPAALGLAPTSGAEASAEPFAGDAAGPGSLRDLSATLPLNVNLGPNWAPPASTPEVEPPTEILRPAARPAVGWEAATMPAATPAAVTSATTGNRAVVRTIAVCSAVLVLTGLVAAYLLAR